MSKTKAFVTGLICGSAVAGIAALLAAPSSGKELRNKVKQKGLELKNSLHCLSADTKLLKEQITQTATEGKEVILELKEDMQKVLSTWKKDVKPNKENIEREIREIQQSIESLQKTVPIQ
ncbi:YtxH domain-containing protein [Microbacteriaceae bacterium 4G12]